MGLLDTPEARVAHARLVARVVDAIGGSDPTTRRLAELVAGYIRAGCTNSAAIQKAQATVGAPATHPSVQAFAERLRSQLRAVELTVEAIGPAALAVA
jgi:hypothetical protein